MIFFRIGRFYFLLANFNLTDSTIMKKGKTGTLFTEKFLAQSLNYLHGMYIFCMSICGLFL
jgi:hypothetical protein